ncbi:MAG: MBL fold metallo-hydrolase [Bdellovibrionales bacterium]|nr:MBL fold metallo-hydrolase [Bdellovibrionales bacterium]
MLKFGKFEICVEELGTFRLDGGAMFGSVPKNIWAKGAIPDEHNCIALTTRSLIIRCDSRVFLIDVGLGDKWSDKEKEIFAIKNKPQSELCFSSSEITDIVLTHLHFDHAGGISRKVDATGSFELCFPHARVWLQKDNWKNAQDPNLKERASYLKANVEPLKQAQLELTTGSQEIFPDLWVHQVNGHTLGQQWIEVRSGKKSLVFPTDLIPTAHHLPVPFHMGYDICAKTILDEKAHFLKKAVQLNWIVVFEHDPDTAACRVTTDERGRFTRGEVIDLSQSTI